MMYKKEDFIIEYINDEQLFQMEDHILLERYGYKYVLLIYEEQNQVQILFLSGSKRIRAVEIMEYMLSEFGLVKGDAGRATGYISRAILMSQMTDTETTGIIDYFIKLINGYIYNTLCIVANEFAIQNEEYIKSLQLYTKQKIKWAAVKSTDIVKKGERFVMKSLENESGEIITANDDIYIMIGCRGEIYEISAEKFDKTYEISQENLNVFKEMLDFIPEVQEIHTGKYISIDDKAKICYPKRDANIYAYKLSGRTKIFPGDGTGEYFLGRSGDFMAIRADDIRDVYIIQKEIFENTYEMCEK